MIDKIKIHIEEAKAFNEKNKEALEQFRIKYLGSKGLLKDFFAEFKNVPNEQKKEFGQVINELKTSAEEKVKTIQDALENKEEAKGAKTEEAPAVEAAPEVVAEAPATEEAPEAPAAEGEAPAAE